MRELPDLFEDVGRNREISAIRERLARLESEKAELEGSLNKLLAAQEARDSPPPVAAYDQSLKQEKNEFICAKIAANWHSATTL